VLIIEGASQMKLKDALGQLFVPNYPPVFLFEH
jgi:hypothetical protein